MKIIVSTSEMHVASNEFHSQGKRVGFVPTMGNLHEGHMQLIQSAKRESDIVVVSIFVNPLQFDQQQDLDNYPVTLDIDTNHLKRLSVDVLFLPAVTDIYPGGQDQCSKVIVPELPKILCGKYRAGHFDGVSTVVAKLFNIVDPDNAFFGQKDFQQFAIIRKLVDDLNFDINLFCIETVRDEDGLAKSSRNQYLTSEQRKVAPCLFILLNGLRKKLEKGDRNYRMLEKQAKNTLLEKGFNAEYVCIRSSQDLFNERPEIDDEIAILAAAWLGDARLIDNLLINKKK